MSILLNGSLCLTDMVAKAKEGHSAFTKGKNGKIYMNVTCWVNDEPNQFGQHASLLLNSSKEKKDAEGKVYIGNMKKSEGGGYEPVTAADAEDLNLPNIEPLPF
jgi:hypothetical protein